MKKQGKKWMLVVLALLAVVTVTLPLVGCKNDTVAEQTGDGTGSGSGNQGTGDPEQPVTYTVSFNTNEGSTVPSQTLERGKTATKPADPTLENNVFGGWYSDEELTSEYDFTTPVTGSFTLYAKWVKRIEVTAYNVSTVIEGLTGDGSYILVVTGELNDLSAITTALDEKPNAKVNLDLSKVSGLTEIGPEAFRGCSGLTSISIPSSVEIIKFLAFEDCSGLTSIDIPEGVTTIGAGAFDGCSSLNIIVNEYNTTYSSEDGMLLNKEKTTLIAYPSAKGTVTNVPTSVTTIVDSAFYGCSGLTSINIPEGVTTIGAAAFDGCDSLTSISIPKGVKIIGVAAFDGCDSLTSITIPSSVTSIGVAAFYGCSSLEEVTMEATTPPELGMWAFNGTAGNLQILVPKGSVKDYWEAENWKEYSGIIEAIPDQTS